MIKENYLQKNKIDNAKTVDMRKYIFYSAALYLFIRAEGLILRCCLKLRCVGVVVPSLVARANRFYSVSDGGA